MSDAEKTITNPPHAAASKDLLKNTAFGIATWPILDGVFSAMSGGKFWTTFKDGFATKAGIVNTIVNGMVVGLSTTLISAILGKYKQPTMVIHQTTTNCPAQEQSAQPSQPAPIVATTPAPEQPTTHTTTTVFAEREVERREAPATTQPSIT